MTIPPEPVIKGVATLATVIAAVVVVPVAATVATVLMLNTVDRNRAKRRHGPRGFEVKLIHHR